MNRHCYCSRVLPGMTDVIRAHWANKSEPRESLQTALWHLIDMTGFDCWLQPSPQGDYLIHCLEGASLSRIFSSLRMQIAAGNGNATKLQAYYQQVLGKDYRDPGVEPHIEQVFDMTVGYPSNSVIRRGFFYPLLPGQEQDYRDFCQESLTTKRHRHEVVLGAVGCSRLTSWIQQSDEGMFIILHAHYTRDMRQQASRLSTWDDMPEFEELASCMRQYTGLDDAGLTPEIEWLTEQWNKQLLTTH